MKARTTQPLPVSRPARIILAAVLFTAALGCGAPPADRSEAPPPPVATEMSRQSRSLPVAVTPSGHRLTLELAMTQEEIQQGLMFRSVLPADRGMLFLFGHPRIPSFWMKNTFVPLDMVFLDQEGTVVDLILDARPCPDDPCPQYIPKTQAKAVLEVAAGVASAQGLAIGSRLHFEGVPGYPVK